MQLSTRERADGVDVSINVDECTVLIEPDALACNAACIKGEIGIIE